MINISSNTLYDIRDVYGRIVTTLSDENTRMYQTYNPYLTPAQWATTSSIDTGSYTLDTEMLYRHFNTSLDPNAFAVIIDDCLPQKEITEDELIAFLEQE